MQLYAGNINSSFLRDPWGIIFSINYLYLLIVAYARSDKWKWVKHLYNHYSMTASLACMTVLCIIFGLCRQDGSVEGISGVLGFHKMSSSWPFVLIFIYFISILGLRAIEEIAHWRTSRKLTMLIHIAVFTTLAAGLFSSGDKERIRITAPVGHPVNIGINESGRKVYLPFDVVLKKFSIEEYPGKLYMINPSDGTSSQEFLTLDQPGELGMLGRWQIRVSEILDMAGKRTDSENYTAMRHVGAAPAVYIHAIDNHGTCVEGWVSCGSHIFPPSVLHLDNSHALAMPQREAASYLSQISIIENDIKTEHDIRVNHPAKHGSWNIYQVSYDRERGRWSTITVLECVRDGWYPIIRTALWMILAAGIAMAATAGSKSHIRKKKEVMP